MDRTPFPALLAAVALAAVTSASATAQGGPFRPVRSYGVPSVAEIVDATTDGRTLVYTDAGSGEFGIVDIANPHQPATLATVPVRGEPTSVSIVRSAGRDWALGTVWADKHVEGSPPPAFQPGKLVVMDLSNPALPVVTGSVDLDWHPDSVKATRIAGYVVAVIAIENEPVVVANGVVTDEDRPGSPNDVSPPGRIQVVVVDLQNPANSTVRDIQLDSATLGAAGLLYPDDPQPEFVDVHGTTAAVSLQENNGIAIVDLSDPLNPALARVFSCGIASSRLTDLSENADIVFDQRYPDLIGNGIAPAQDAGGNPVPGGARFPDAIAFTPDGTAIVSADEGELDFTGGRGFSIWTLAGGLVYEDNGFMEDIARDVGQFPEGRAEAKGIEVEGVTTGVFGGRPYAFLMSERGSFMCAFDITQPMRPQLVNVLATGISPEGIVAIPQRELLVTADEVSGTLTMFRFGRTPYEPSPNQPLLVRAIWSDSWAAISGMAGSSFSPDVLWGVPDNAMPTAIYGVLVGGPYADVGSVLPVRRNGRQARYDGEGICNDTSVIASATAVPGWWIASEGDASSNPNLLVQVGIDGRVLREIQLPVHIDPAANPSLGGNAQGPVGGQTIRSNGFEGVCLSSDGRYLIACIQRDFAGESSAMGPRYARIARYDLQQIVMGTAPVDGLRHGGDWEFFYVELDSSDADNWAGLSEIVNLEDGRFAFIERDKGIGLGSSLKKVYAFNFSGLSADADGLPDASDTITKVELFDVVRDFFPYEKIESLALTTNGSLWIGLDNDGGEVEARLRNLGRNF